MNSKVALVLSYCNTDEKLNILKENISVLKSNHIDVCVISPIFLDVDIQSLCDYFLYTKENPVLSWPERAYVYWVNQTDERGNQFVMKYADIDYYWTVLYQIKTSFSLISDMGYSEVVIMNYDLDTSNNLLSHLNDLGNLMFNTKYDEHDTSISPLLLSQWKSDDLKRILDSITKDEWVKYPNLAEDYFKSKVGLLNIEFSIPNLIISDLIAYYATTKKMETWTDIDNFKYGFKLYTTNMHDLNIWIYEFERKPENVEIEIVLKMRNCLTYKMVEFKDTMIKTQQNCNDVYSLKITIDGYVVDLTNILLADAKQLIEYSI